MRVIPAIFAVLSIMFVELSANPTLVSRSMWGARPPRWALSRFSEPRPFVVVHHTATASCLTRSSCSRQVRGIQTSHQRKWNDIGYNFLISPSGDIYEARGWDFKGAHSGSGWYNGRSIGIAFIGNYVRSDVTNAAWQSFEDLLAEGKRRSKLTRNVNVKGHSDIKQTQCPGAVLKRRLQNLR